MRAWPTGGLWRHADFLKLWSAETISQFGSQISGIALPLEPAEEEPRSTELGASLPSVADPLSPTDGS